MGRFSQRAAILTDARPAGGRELGGASRRQQENQHRPHRRSCAKKINKVSIHYTTLLQISKTWRLYTMKKYTRENQ